MTFHFLTKNVRVIFFFNSNFKEFFKEFISIFFSIFKIYSIGQKKNKQQSVSEKLNYVSM